MNDSLVDSVSQEWRWVLEGNIKEYHEYGENREIKYGTKQFSSGTKVYLAPAQWGDGYEYIVAIGLAKGNRKYIQIVTRRSFVENFRLQKIFKPAILERMKNSKYRFWGNTDKDREDIIKYLSWLNPKEEAL